MATFKTDEQLRKYLTKRVETDVTRKSWNFNGIKFTSYSVYFTREFTTCVRYVCTLKELRASIERGYECNGTYELIADKTFDNENAIPDCVQWVVDKLIEIYKLLNERIAPYANNKMLYDVMLNRPIKLQEGN